MNVIPRGIAPLAAIGGLTVIEVVALQNGINGTLFFVVAVAIAGLGGYSLNWLFPRTKVEPVEDDLDPPIETCDAVKSDGQPCRGIKKGTSTRCRWHPIAHSVGANIANPA
jgi:hypothetical protein